MDFSLKTKSFNHIFVICLCFLMSTISVYFLTISLNKGFNITDESYYLLSMTQANKRLFELSHFGFELGSLFKLCRENLIIFRAVGIMLLFSISIMFTVTVNQYFTLSKRPFTPLSIFVISSSSFFYYSWGWLITPAYNWLNYIAILFIGIGLFSNFKQGNQQERHYFRLFLYACLVGLGEALSFISKPPSALVLAGLILFWCLYHFKKEPSSRKPLFFLLISGLSGSLFILIHAIIYFGDFQHFLENILRSLEATKVIKVHTDLATVFIKAIVTILKNLFHRNLIIILTFFFTLFLSYYSAKKFFTDKVNSKIQKILVHFYLCSSFIIFYLTIFSLFIKDFYHAYSYKLLNIFQGTAIFIFTVMFLFSYKLIQSLYQNKKKPISYTIDKNLEKKPPQEMHFSDNIIIPIFLISMTFAFAIGTINDIIYQIFGTSMFMIMAVFILLTNLEKLIGNNLYFYIMSVTTSIFLVLGCYHGYLHPYELSESIKNQIHPIKLLNYSYPIYVDTKTARYFNSFESAALKNKWHQGTSLIDLTGASVGALVALKAQIPGVVWFGGGFTGSNDYVDYILNKIPLHVVEQAWVLTSDNGKRAIESSMLTKRFNAGEYVAIAELINPLNNEKQVLWKPKEI